MRGDFRKGTRGIQPGYGSYTQIMEAEEQQTFIMRMAARRRREAREDAELRAFDPHAQAVLPCTAGTPWEPLTDADIRAMARKIISAPMRMPRMSHEDKLLSIKEYLERIDDATMRAAVAEAERQYAALHPEKAPPVPQSRYVMVNGRLALR